MATEVYWAGGSAKRWFVKLRRSSPWVGHPDEQTLVREFPSADFADGEIGAARAANSLARELNAQVTA